MCLSRGDVRSVTENHKALGDLGALAPDSRRLLLLAYTPQDSLQGRVTSFGTKAEAS